ncbi:hypothetical protein KCU61_g439, partial [Aureobasidium melanogenum]
MILDSVEPDTSTVLAVLPTYKFATSILALCEDRKSERNARYCLSRPINHGKVRVESSLVANQGSHHTLLYALHLSFGRHVIMSRARSQQTDEKEQQVSHKNKLSF